MAVSLAFSKGMLRASALLSLLCQWWRQGTGNLLLMTFETLKESVQMIHVHCVKHLTLQDEVFHNFRLSIRGSLRRPPNVMTWVGTLSKLRNKGYQDCTSLIARFNQTVAISFQLIGGKSVAVGNLMNFFSQDLLDYIQAHVSQWGWEGCCLSDDVLSSKKILPTHVFKSPHKSWKRLVAMSEDSCMLLFRRIFSDHEKAPGKKMEKSTVEQQAERAALVTNLAKELCQNFPVQKADVQREILDKWVARNHALELELYEVQSETRANLTVTDIPFFRHVAESLQCQKPVTDSHGTVELRITQLDQDKFQLVLSQLSYDMNAFRIYKKKIEDVQTNVRHVKMEWQKKRHEENQQWVTSWLAKKSCILDYKENEEGSLLQQLRWRTC